MMNFAQQADEYIKHIQTRKRKPVKKATVVKYRGSLVHATDFFGNADLSTLDNPEMKAFVTTLDKRGFGASTINGIVSVAKQVVASARGPRGEQLYPRIWNDEFIDLPLVDPRVRKAPRTTGPQVTEAISEAFGQYKALYALLAGSGLRIAEAQALFIGPNDGVNSTWDPDEAMVYVRTTVVQGAIQNAPKTPAGVREVDLHPELNTFLKNQLKPVRGEHMFKSPNGGLMVTMTAWLHLNKTGIEGFHSFRRFRCTHLNSEGCPTGLERYWIGHSMNGSHERYISFEGEIEKRKAEAKRIGLGFDLCS